MGYQEPIPTFGRNDEAERYTGRSVERVDRRSRKNGATGNATVMAMLRLTLVLAFTCTATAAAARDCEVVEPDSLQISWTAPCEDGSWLLDPQAGCRLWDWHPAPEDSATWSGTCPAGRKQGPGTVQWFEHGRPIDRFEGISRRASGGDTAATPGRPTSASKAT